jgi:ATPase family protein associated with various cellular activities (AAA)
VSDGSTMALFDDDAGRPLADRLRPRALDEVVGQDHLLADDAAIGRMVAQHRLVSMILWGPPGCGKTTIARLLAEQTNLVFESLSATFSGVADLRKVFQTATKRRQAGQGTLLFVDEIAVLPLPAVPRSTNALLRPARTSASTVSIRAHSRSRPTSLTPRAYGGDHPHSRQLLWSSPM